MMKGNIVQLSSKQIKEITVKQEESSIKSLGNNNEDQKRKKSTYSSVTDTLNFMLMPKNDDDQEMESKNQELINNELI